MTFTEVIDRSFQKRYLALSDTDMNNLSRALQYRNKVNYSMLESPVKDETLPNIATEIHQTQKRLSNTEIAQMIAAYNAGASMRDLAKQFGCHKITISNRLKNAGVKLHGVPANKKQIDEMVRLYESGLSLADTGKRVGVSANTVLRYLRQRRIETRDPHEQTK